MISWYSVHQKWEKNNSPDQSGPGSVLIFSTKEPTSSAANAIGFTIWESLSSMSLAKAYPFLPLLNLRIEGTCDWNGKLCICNGFLGELNLATSWNISHWYRFATFAVCRSKSTLHLTLLTLIGFPVWDGNLLWGVLPVAELSILITLERNGDITGCFCRPAPTLGTL